MTDRAKRWPLPKVLLSGISTPKITVILELLRQQRTKLQAVACVAERSRITHPLFRLDGGNTLAREHRGASASSGLIMQNFAFEQRVGAAKSVLPRCLSSLSMPGPQREIRHLGMRIKQKERQFFGTEIWLASNCTKRRTNGTCLALITVNYVTGGTPTYRKVGSMVHIGGNYL